MSHCELSLAFLYRTGMETDGCLCSLCTDTVSLEDGRELTADVVSKAEETRAPQKMNSLWM